MRIFFAATSAALAIAAAAPAHALTVPRFDHVVIIMLENHSDLSIVGNPNAPKITRLAFDNAYGSAYYGVTHPSLPNYVAMTSGNNWYSNSDDPTQRFDHRNIVDQLEERGMSWKAYMQALPSAGFSGNFYPTADPDAALYVIRHDPFMLYADVAGNPARRRRVVPLERLADDLRTGKLPRFAWISPDICHDMHGMSGPQCPYGNDPALRRAGDEFVAQWVTRIVQSRAWTNRSVIFITTDETTYNGNKLTGGWLNANACCDAPVVAKGFPEFPKGGAYGGGLVPMIVISGIGKKHFVSNVVHSHYSVLRTIEESWGLGYLGMAADANQVRSMWEFFRR